MSLPMSAPLRKHGEAGCSQFHFAKELSLTSLRQRLTEDMQVRNLSLCTQATYILRVSLFARYFRRSPETLGPEEIRAYQVFLVSQRRLAPHSVGPPGNPQAGDRHGSITLPRNPQVKPSGGFLPPWRDAQATKGNPPRRVADTVSLDKRNMIG